MLFFLVARIFVCLQNLSLVLTSIIVQIKYPNYKISNLYPSFFHLNLFGIDILDSEGFHGFMSELYGMNTLWNGYICQGYYLIWVYYNQIFHVLISFWFYNGADYEDRIENFVFYKGVEHFSHLL